MSALHDALAHPVNRPRPLVEWLASIVNPGADLRGLEDGGGVVCDFRPGLEEKDPSLSVSVGSVGAVFKRFGGDGVGMGAVEFTMSALNVPRGEAARLLIERAGIVDTPGEGRKSDHAAPRVSKRAADLARMTDRLGKLAPLGETEAAKRLRGWERLAPGSTGQEAAEVARRGLSPALGGQLGAYRWTGQDGGKTLKLPGHIKPGALAFEITGPGGQPWAVKVRNPGSAGDLKDTGGNRYAYLGKGSGSPALYLPGEERAAAHLITEGELNAVAVRVMLDAATGGGALHVQGVASAEALPHVSPVQEGHAVYLYADPDAAGDKARQKWAALFQARGAQVYQIGQGGGLFGASPDTDACDALGKLGEGDTPHAHAATLGARLLSAISGAASTPSQEEDSEESGQAGDVWIDRQGYGVRGGKLCALGIKRDPDGGADREVSEELCNFTAIITAQITQEDGSGEVGKVFQIEGTQRGQPMRPAHVLIPAAKFDGMRWPVEEWGAAAVVHAGQGKKDKARAAIQLLSDAAGMAQRTVYQHTGWTIHPDHGPVYLTAGAVIGAAGGVEGVDVELSGRLDAYALPDPATVDEAEMRAAVRASLDLLELAPDSVGVPVLGAAYRAPLGAYDAVVWLTGQTGRNKTSFLGPVQAHYGAAWSRHYLPDGWNSSANSLERTAFMVKDAVFLVDDFKPSGSTGEAAKAHGTVGRILQGVADGQGRATLTVDRKSRAGLYPRGVVLTSSETQPRGHSNRARAVIVPVSKKLIPDGDKAMSAAYFAAEDKAASGVYALALASYLQTLAGDLDAVKVGSPAHRARVRHLAPHFEGAHGRTGHAAAELAYGWEVFLAFAVSVGAVTVGEGEALWARVVSALEDTARGQGEHLTDEDPTARAVGVLSGLLAKRAVYLEDLRGGGDVPPEAAPMCGYVRSDHGEGESYRTRPGAALVGWYSKTGGDEWGHFLPDDLHEALQRAVSGQGGALLPDAGTLYANMRDTFQPRGLMRCEAIKKGGAVTGHRVTAKATRPDTGSQERLITLRLPISPELYSGGILGISGIDGEESTYSTGNTAIPLTLFFKEKNGIYGIGAAVAAVSSLDAVPAAGPALDLEELPWESVPEGEDLPGVVLL